MILPRLNTRWQCRTTSLRTARGVRWLSLSRRQQYCSSPVGGSVGPRSWLLWWKTRRPELLISGYNDTKKGRLFGSSCSLYIYFKATSFVKYKYKLWHILITKLKQKWTHQKSTFTAVASLLCTSSVPQGEYQHCLKTLLYKQLCSFAC